MRALAVIGGLTAVAVLVAPWTLGLLTVAVVVWAARGLRATLAQQPEPVEVPDTAEVTA